MSPFLFFKMGTSIVVINCWGRNPCLSTIIHHVLTITNWICLVDISIVPLWSFGITVWDQHNTSCYYMISFILLPKCCLKHTLMAPSEWMKQHKKFVDQKWCYPIRRHSLIYKDTHVSLKLLWPSVTLRLLFHPMTSLKIADEIPRHLECQYRQLTGALQLYQLETARIVLEAWCFWYCIFSFPELRKAIHENSFFLPSSSATLIHW